MNNGRHYEKVVCTCCFLFLCVNVGFPSTSFNVYQPYLVDMVGNTAGSLVLATRTLVSLICMVFVARFYKKLDCRWGVFIATLCTAAAFLVYSFSSSAVGFCLGAVLAGAGYGMGGFAGMTLVIGRWYKSHVGRALGIAAMGSGLASIVVPVAATWVIHAASLGCAFRIQALVALVVGVTVFALLRNEPDAQHLGAGMEVEDHHLHEGHHVAVSVPHGPEHPRKTTVAGRRRRAMEVAMLCLGAITQGGTGYISVLMRSEGFDPFFVAHLLTLFGACLMLAKLANGAIFDAVGTRRGSVIFFVMFNVGLALCCLAHLQSPVLMTVAVAMVGIGTTLGSVGISMWCIDLSTDADRPGLVRDLQVSYSVGGFLINLIPGVLMDAFGTYEISFAIMAVCGLVCMLVVGRVYSSHAVE